MLEFIRRRAQGIIAWIIVGLIIIPFALWGIQEYFGGGKEIPVATVNGSEISQQRLQQAYYERQQQLQSMLGENYRPDMFPEAPMKKAALDALIERELMVQAARDAGMRIGDRMLAETIRSVPAFQDENGFSAEAYNRALRMRGLSPAGFEYEVRRDLLVSELRGAITESAFVTPSETAEFQRLQNQKRDVGALLFPLDKFLTKVEVSDEAVRSYYEENQERFTQPEQVRIAYLELSTDKLAEGIEVSETEAREYYQNHLDEFRAPEERKASHILFAAREGADEEAEKKALEQAQNAREQLTQGAKFEELARKLSADTESAKKGGDLGWFGRGVMVQSFEEKVFSMEEGTISEPVRSPFGYHLIRLDEVRGGEAKSFESVKEEVRTAIKQERARERFYELAEQFGNLTYEHPETLQVAAEQLGLSVQESGFFSRSGGTGVASNPKVAQAAFSEDVLERGNNSEVVELSSDHLVVLRVADRKPEAVRPVEEVKGQIVAQLKRELASAAAQEAAGKALEELQAGASPEALARKQGAEWKRATVTRTASELSPAVVQTAFRLAHPAGSPTIERSPLPGGGEAVVVLYDVEQGAVAAEQGGDKAEQVRRAQAEALFEGFVQSLHSQADVTVNRDRM